MPKHQIISVLFISVLSMAANAQDFYKFYPIQQVRRDFQEQLEKKNTTTGLYWADYIQTVENDKDKLDSLSILSLVDEIRLFHQLGMYENATDQVEKLYGLGGKLDNPKKYETHLANKAILYGFGMTIKHYLYLSEVRKAENYAEKLAAKLPKLNATRSDIAFASLQLSSFYISTGLFQKADSLLQAHFPELALRQSPRFNDIHQLEALKIYGDLYAALKNRKKGKEFYSMAYQGYEKEFGFHAEMIQLLLRLGEVSVQEKAYTQADEYFEKSLAILAKKVGKIHRLYANALSLMAQSRDYANQTDKNATQRYHLESLKIYKILKRENELEYALALQRWLYHRLFVNPNAKLGFEISPQQEERLISQALRIIDRELSKESIESITSISQSGIWHFQNGSPEKGRAELMQSNARLTKKMYEQTAFLTEAEQVDMIEFLEQRFAFTYSYIINYAHLFPELGGAIFDNFMILKGLLVNSKNVILQGLQQNTQSERANKALEELRENQERLSKLITKEKAPSAKKIEELNLLIESSQKELRKLVPGYELLSKTFDKNWKSVRDSLSDKSILIDFIHFQYFDVETKQKSDKVVYCALLLKKEYAFPRVIRLFEEKDLALLMKQKNNLTEDYVAQLYEGRSIGKKITNTNTTNKPSPSKPPKPSNNAVNVEPINQSIIDKDALYNLIWAKIDSSCDGKVTVYFSPTGLLHKIAFGGISKGQKMLIDRFQLVQLTNARGVLEKGNPKFNTTDDIVLFGGIDYNLQANSTQKTGISPLSSSQVNTQNSTWDDLPGTKIEVNQIKPLFSNPVLFEGTNATETSFKALSGKSSKIIHLATHGFFADSTFIANLELSQEQRTLAFFSSSDPLIRSGLLLAGANQAWGNNRAQLDQEDGVLTAYELANLDLSKTKLAVLSACETGLGDISNTEGVFGLQRALKMAGVEQYIISLWEVPDKETQELMTIFYKKLVEGTTIQDAFTYAQREMRKKYSPYFWAAFVLVR